MSKTVKAAEHVVDAVSDVVTTRRLNPKKLAIVAGTAAVTVAALVLVAKIKAKKAAKASAEVEIVVENKEKDKAAHAV